MAPVNRWLLDHFSSLQGQSYLNPAAVDDLGYSSRKHGWGIGAPSMSPDSMIWFKRLLREEPHKNLPLERQGGSSDTARFRQGSSHPEGQIGWYVSWSHARPWRMLWTTKRVFVALAVLALLSPVAQVYAQQASMASGQLVKVDTTAQMLTIRAANNQQMAFNYTKDTKVTGSDQGVAGLATQSGVNVTVHYQTQGQNKIATEIDVQARQ
jgi:hypothetical protein